MSENTQMTMLKIAPLNDFKIDAEEIVRIQALSNYSRIYFSNGKNLVVAKVLHLFEDMLPLGMFARVHRSHLINKRFIRKMNDHSKKVLLENGETITVSRRKRKSILL